MDMPILSCAVQVYKNIQEDILGEVTVDGPTLQSHIEDVAQSFSRLLPGAVSSPPGFK